MEEMKRTFEFLKDVFKEKDINLDLFDEFAKILKIPVEIRLFARKLVIRHTNINNKRNCRLTFIIYLAVFFISYIKIKGDVFDLKKKLKLLVEKAHSFSTVTKAVNVIRILKIFLNRNKWLQYIKISLGTLEEEEKIAFNKNLYKIVTLELFFKLNEKTNLGRYFVDKNEINRFLKPVYYIIKSCYLETFVNFSELYSGAAYYFFCCSQFKSELHNVDQLEICSILNLDLKLFKNSLSYIKSKIVYENYVSRFKEETFTLIRYRFKSFNKKSTNKLTSYNNYSYSKQLIN